MKTDGPGDVRGGEWGRPYATKDSRTEFEGIEDRTLGLDQCLTVHLEVGKTFLLVHRNGIVDLRSHPVFRQMRTKGIAPPFLDADRVLVPHVECVGILYRQDDLVLTNQAGLVQQTAVTCGNPRS